MLQQKFHLLSDRIPGERGEEDVGAAHGEREGDRKSGWVRGFQLFCQGVQADDRTEPDGVPIVHIPKGIKIA